MAMHQIRRVFCSQSILILSIILTASSLVTTEDIFDPDLHLDVPQTVRRHGYPGEAHTVETKDGYILTMHRIPYGKQKTKDGTRQPVFIQHGLTGNSWLWILQGPGKALAYVLADAGYDVWLGNARGSPDSRAHSDLSPSSPIFWDFSFHEMGTEDLPTAIEYIVKVTGQPKLHYIGHSMGTTMFFVMASMKPNTAERIASMHALAPVVFASNMNIPIRRLARFANDFQFLSMLMGNGELEQDSRLLKYLARLGCDLLLEDKRLCTRYDFASSGGTDPDQYNSSLTPLLLAHPGNGASTKTVIHYLQLMKTGKFQQFDYGFLGNVAFYNATSPPSYNLSKVNVPVFLYYSDGDKTADAKPQTIRRHGYPVEAHTVETADGYILTLHRIPRGRIKPSGGPCLSVKRSSKAIDEMLLTSPTKIDDLNDPSNVILSSLPVKTSTAFPKSSEMNLETTTESVISLPATADKTSTNTNPTTTIPTITTKSTTSSSTTTETLPKTTTSHTTTTSPITTSAPHTTSASTTTFPTTTSASHTTSAANTTPPTTTSASHTTSAANTTQPTTTSASYITSAANTTPPTTTSASYTTSAANTTPPTTTFPATTTSATTTTPLTTTSPATTTSATTTTPRTTTSPTTTTTSATTTTHSPEPTIRPPILLHHGLMGSSYAWVIAGPKKGLAYLLADAGYDVWMANARGTTYSRAHVCLPTNPSSLFWDFSFHEIGVYDIPAAVDHILRVTGAAQLHFVGHSMGATAFFAMAAARPEVAARVASAHALAPVVFARHMKSPLRILAPFACDVEFLARILGRGQLLPENKIMHLLAKYGCETLEIEKRLCRNLIFVLYGFDSEQFDLNLLPLLLSHTSHGASTKTVIHYAQLVNSGKFQQFDYGPTENMRIYNSLVPPAYNISKIKVPVHLYYSSNDWLASTKDVDTLFQSLRCKKTKYLVPLAPFNHIDFILAKDVKKLLYDTILKQLPQL